MDNINRLHDKIDRIEVKVDTIVETLSHQGTKLEVYNVELERHIEGVKLAREENALLRALVEQKTAKLEAQIEPIQAHVSSVKSVMKFVKFLFGILASIGSILKFFKKF
jgi:uncharacterized protein YaaN involved in tellurite resistance